MSEEFAEKIKQRDVLVEKFKNECDEHENQLEEKKNRMDELRNENEKLKADTKKFRESNDKKESIIKELNNQINDQHNKFLELQLDYENRIKLILEQHESQLIEQSSKIETPTKDSKINTDNLTQLMLDVSHNKAIGINLFQEFLDKINENQELKSNKALSQIINEFQKRGLDYPNPIVPQSPRISISTPTVQRTINFVKDPERKEMECQTDKQLWDENVNLRFNQVYCEGMLP